MAKKRYTTISQAAYHEVPEGKKRYRCLRCRRYFISDGPHNRICRWCKRFKGIDHEERELPDWVYGNPPEKTLFPDSED